MKLLFYIVILAAKAAFFTCELVHIGYFMPQKAAWEDYYG